MLDPIVRNYMSSLGKVGGKSKSPRKLKAANANLKKAWANHPATKRNKLPQGDGQ
jgi:hypothetical protein